MQLMGWGPRECRNGRPWGSGESFLVDGPGTGRDSGNISGVG